MSAASGTGKSSLCQALVAKETRTVLSISHTTREKRGKEKHGEHYFFTSFEEFQGMIEKEEFVEYAEVYGCYYGTSHKMIEENFGAGNNVILEIDWKGAEQVKRQYPSALRVLLLPPSLQELEVRLRTRAQDSQATINKRLALALDDIRNCLEYDVWIVNDEFEDALADLESLLPGNTASRRPLPPNLLESLGVRGDK